MNMWWIRLQTDWSLLWNTTELKKSTFLPINRLVIETQWHATLSLAFDRDCSHDTAKISHQYKLTLFKNDLQWSCTLNSLCNTTIDLGYSLFINLVSNGSNQISRMFLRLTGQCPMARGFTESGLGAPCPKDNFYDMILRPDSQGVPLVL